MHIHRQNWVIIMAAALGYSEQHATIKQDYRTLKFQRNTT